MKRSVVLCGSRQKREGLWRFHDELAALGIAVLKPDFEGPKHFSDMEEEERMKYPEYRIHLESMVRAHLERIRNADLTFMYNEDGKFGTNTRLEFDYARKHGKPIFSLLPLPARHQMYVEAVITSAQALLPWLGDYIALVGEPHDTADLDRWGEELKRPGVISLILTDLSPRSLHRLDTADAVFVYNPKKSFSEDIVAILGSAVAHGKPIYAYDKDPVEICCNTFFHPKQVRSPDELLAILYPGQQASQQVLQGLTA